MLKRFTAIILSLLLFNNLLRAQDYGSYIDSLEKVAARVNPSSDTAASVYLNVARTILYQSPRLAFKYLHKAIDGFEAKQDYHGICMSYSFLGIAYGQLGNFEKAFENFNIQMHLAKEHNVLDEYVWANNNLGHSMLLLKNPVLAKPYIMEALRRAPEVDVPHLLHNIYFNVGSMYHLQNEYDSSIYWYTQCLELRLTEKESDNKSIAAAYRDMGNVYYSCNDYAKAMECYRLSDSLVANEFTDIPAGINSYRASIYLNSNKLDSAYYFANKAIEVARIFNSRDVLRYSYGVLGRIFSASGQYQEAEKAFAKQILYNDSIVSENTSWVIFENEFKREIDRQNTDIREVEGNVRTNALICIIIVVVLLALVILYFRIKSKSRIINSINKEMDEHDAQMNTSLRYASMVQKIVLPDFAEMDGLCLQKFLIYDPKKEISADLFWQYQKSENLFMFAVGGCGIPDFKGACITMIATSLLYESASQASDIEGLVELARHKFMSIIRNLNIESEYSQSSDISIASVDRESRLLRFLGVKCPLVIVRNGSLIIYNENAEPGSCLFNARLLTDEIELKPGDSVYFMTQGFCNQTGEKDGKPFSLNRLYALLLEISDKPMDMQEQLLRKALSDWRGSREQDFDVTIAGFKFF
ncbi:MAG: tetratricopeptide repeat protein [Bacteroidales bacterium]|nr:tetratricopeptide repeat protein [Bacteroidales bacterium]